MDISATKLELMQQLMSIVDEKTLRKVASFFKKEIAIVEDDDISDEEVAELESLRAERLRGEGSSHTWEDVQRMAREMVEK